MSKYDYCQACHLHLNDCKCEKTFKVETVESIAGETVYPIYLSTWKIQVNGFTKTVKNITVKGENEAQIKANSTYINRALREINNPSKYNVLSVELNEKIGESLFKS